MNNKFLTNYTEDRFIDHIKKCLATCDSFSFSVSFIKKAGLDLLYEDIEKALLRNVKGRIITSSYQNFTDIASLNTFKNWMDKYKNFDCHFDYNCFGDNGFHNKGYLFEYKDSFEVIVGSSNITRYALLKNIEWNVSTFDKDKTTIYEPVIEEFNSLWNKTIRLDEKIIKTYQESLEYAIEKWDMDYYYPDFKVISPNRMQIEALKEIQNCRDRDEDKALITVATGAGKTYLAAFDAKVFDARRLLFICHRDAILESARKAFSDVFGDLKTYGIFGNGKKELTCDFVFASTLSLSNNLNLFKEDEFDYIVYDEAHHIATKSGGEIYNYFKPQFLLGLTATPDRTDNKSVVEFFNYNIPYELSIKDGILNGLIVPFHYYGIRDELISYNDAYNEKTVAKNIRNSINVDFIVREIEKHKKQGEKLKAIAFYPDVESCDAMAKEFSNRGYDSIGITGVSKTGERFKAFKDLQDDNNSLNIVCTVDVLNEGVDIPGINMVIFLRPTESSIIFLQQLGRGLRKYPNKEYVTVLDFIANDYRRSMHIAHALGEVADIPYYSHSMLMDLIKTDFTSINIPGVIIDIDELSRKEILDSLSNENVYEKKKLLESYSQFKKIINCKGYPKHVDYLNNKPAPELLLYLKSKTNGKKNMSYFNFLKNTINENGLPEFDTDQIRVINAISELLPLTRPDEYLLLSQLIDNKLDMDNLVKDNVTLDSLKNAIWYLKEDSIIDENNNIKCDINEELKEYLNDLIQYGLLRYESEYGNSDSIFKIYGSYYTTQVMKGLGIKNPRFQQGTFFNKDLCETTVFVTLEKEKSNEKYKYEDGFANNKIFAWESKNDTTLTSGDGPKILETKKVYLFVRKSKESHGTTMPYIYFGTGVFDKIQESSNPNKTLIMNINLDNEINEKYYYEFKIPTE